MSYTLDALADDIRRELSHGSAAAKEAVCRHVSRALTDREFVAAYLKDRPAGSDPREVLYEDRISASASALTSMAPRRSARPMITVRAGRSTVKPPVSLK